MKKIIANNDESNEIVFTPAAVLDLLSKIDEFKEFDLGLSESLDGNLQLQVGESFYDIDSNEVANDVKVDDEVVDEISSINEEAYEDLFESGQAISEEPIESGLIKETLKTLLIGGVVRLGKHLLTN